MNIFESIYLEFDHYLDPLNLLYKYCIVNVNIYCILVFPLKFIPQYVYIAAKL